MDGGAHHRGPKVSRGRGVPTLVQSRPLTSEDSSPYRHQRRRLLMETAQMDADSQCSLDTQQERETQTAWHTTGQVIWCVQGSVTSLISQRHDI